MFVHCFIYAQLCVQAMYETDPTAAVDRCKSFMTAGKLTQILDIKKGIGGEGGNTKVNYNE